MPTFIASSNLAIAWRVTTRTGATYEPTKLNDVVKSLISKGLAFKHEGTLHLTKLGEAA